LVSVNSNVKNNLEGWKDWKGKKKRKRHCERNVSEPGY